VGQGVWNPSPGWAQTLPAIGPGDWHASANMPAGNTAVVSLPNVGQQYDENKLAGFSSIYSSFTEDMQRHGRDQRLGGLRHLAEQLGQRGHDPA
jgi:hypothetical protein